MTRTLRTDYAAYNARGVQVRTFNDLKHARAWVRNNAIFHEGLHLQEVSLVARKIYTPRGGRRPAQDFNIPVFA